MNHIAKHGIAKEKLMKHKGLITPFAIGGLINVLIKNTTTLARGRKFGPVIALGLVVSSICLGWSVLPPSAPQLERGLFLAYGPADFVRSAGKPAPDLRNFSLPNTQTEYRLQIFNGGLNSQFAGASSAVVTVNGRQIASPADFNQNVRLIERALIPATENSLAVELRSAPKTGLTLRVVGVDTQPPTITAAAAPSANALGWNNTDVTVSFSCGDSISGIENCPSPVTVTGEGAAQLITGTATDRAQNSSEASLTINLDKTSPVLTVTSPANGAVVSDQTLTVNGTISDALSGVANVTCDDVAASLSGASFTCVRSLNQGANAITVEAADRAGNRTSTVVNVTRNPEVIEEEEGDIKSARLAPDVIFVGESEPVTVSARIPYDHTSGAPQVTLQRIDDAGNVLGVEGLLRDNGDAAQGDLLAGDGLFSFRNVYTAVSSQQLLFRISYQQNGTELKSKPLHLGFYDRLTDEQINAILSTQQGAAQNFASLSPSLGEAEAIAAVLAQLRQNPLVITAGLSADDSTISVLYSPGIIGAIYLYEPRTRGGGSGGSSTLNRTNPTQFGNFASAVSTVPMADDSEDEEDEENKIDSRRAIILSPFHSQFAPHDESPELKQLFEEKSCPAYEVTYLLNQAASVDSFKSLDQYGIVAIVSHGTKLWQGLFGPHGGFHGIPIGTEVYSLITSEEATAAAVGQRQFDLVSGRLGIVTLSSRESNVPATKFGILPTFIPYYSEGEFPNSLVYLGTCHSAANDTMSQAFLQQGAKTYLGFSKVVSAIWAREVALDFFEKFLGDPLKVAGGADGAFTPNQYDILPCLQRNGNLFAFCNTPEDMERERRRHGALFKLVGSEELERPNLLLNAGFEAGDMDGWDFAFESTVVSQLGDVQPEDGDYMGMVFKNTSKNFWFGWLQQEFCLPTDVTRIEFDWNFITEQQCDSLTDSPDVLQVRLVTEDYYELYHPVLDTDVQKLCSQFRPTTIDLPSEGTARAAGWQHASIDITEVAQRMNGKKVQLVFEVTSWGQHMNRTADTVVLIDNIKIVREDDAP